MTNAKVVLVPSDEGWPVAFEALRDVYSRALGGLALAIEHVGSTSVPGLLAKPVIDIDVVIESRSQLPAVVEALATLGYRHNGDQGIPGREAFPRDHDEVPRDGSGRSWPLHHLYVCARDAAELRRHLLFRDWLRAHPTRAAEYGALKLRLAELHDPEGYCEAKTDFVQATLREAAGTARGAGS